MDGHASTFIEYIKQKKMTLVSPSQLKAIAPTLPTLRSQSITDLLNIICPTYNIIGSDFKQFLAQILVECGEFSIKRESNYFTHLGRLQEVWPTRVFDGSFLRNPQKLCNTVYANRMGNGDIASGDGYKYRGGGNLQLTGKESYIKCGAALGLDLVNHPELLEDDKNALLSACWEFVHLKCLGVGNVERVTRLVNGGETGLQQREAYYGKILKILV